MRVCGVLAPVPPGHGWFDLVSAERDTARELHDLLVALAAIGQTGADISVVAGRGPAIDLLQEIKDHAPDLVVLAASSARWPGAVALAPRIRRVTRARLVLYGDHVLRFPEHALETCPTADQAVVAGVDALVEVVNRASLGRSPEKIAGVWDRSGPAAPRAAWDGPLPTPLWSRLRGIHPLDSVATALGLRMGPAVGPFGGSAESPESVARSLERAGRLRPRNGVIGLDTSLGSDTSWVRVLCERLRRGASRPRWSCTLVPRDVTLPLARQLSSAGCSGVTLDLGALGARGADGFAAEVAAAARALASAKIPLTCELVFGAPGSSQRTDRGALKIAERYATPSGIQPRLFRPEPGSDEWVEDKWLPARWVEAQLQPARAVYWPRGYGSLGEVEAEWRLAWLKGAVTGPSRVAGSLMASLRRRPAAREPSRPRS